MKIGIYSGTFDPVHEGHVAFAKEATKQCGIDKVFFLPEPRPRRKQGVKALEHRMAMTSLAIQDENNLGMIILEQQRFTPRETMPVLRSRFEGAELCMLMGDDMLDHFAGADWPHVEELIESIKFIIGIRKYDKQRVIGIAKTLKDVRGLDLRYELFQPTNFELSSQQIKKAVKSKQDFAGLDSRVAVYIKKNGLYSNDD